MQLSAIRTRASERLNEGATGPVYYPAAELDAAINEAQRLFVLLTLCLEATKSWTPGNVLTHMLTVSGFGDWIAPLRITDGPTGATVRCATLADLTALDPSWVTTGGGGSPLSRYVTLGGDLLVVYGTASSLNVTYARSPVKLVADTDVPEIPEEYHQHLAGYSIYRARMVEGAQEFAKTLGYFAAYLDASQRYAHHVRARNVGARYDKQPMELSLMDRSKLLNLRGDLLPVAGPLPTGDGIVPVTAG
jgi:hypothetical protein